MKRSDLFPYTLAQPPYSPTPGLGQPPAPSDRNTPMNEHVHQGICNNCQIRLDDETLIDGPLRGWVCMSGFELGHSIALEQAKVEAIGHFFDLIDQAKWAIEKLTAYRP